MVGLFFFCLCLGAPFSSGAPEHCPPMPPIHYATDQDRADLRQLLMYTLIHSHFSSDLHQNWFFFFLRMKISRFICRVTWVLCIRVFALRIPAQLQTYIISMSEPQIMIFWLYSLALLGAVNSVEFSNHGATAEYSTHYHTAAGLEFKFCLRTLGLG